jgi:hypothetical protein
MLQAGNTIRWLDPKTWPWFFYVWIAIILANWLRPLWRWFQRQREARWPSNQGRIESVVVRPKAASQAAPPFLKAFSFQMRRDSTPHVVELGYTYSAGGQEHRGSFKTELATSEEAQEFARDLKDKSVSVHYNPDKPAVSVIPENALKALQETRPPAAAVSTAHVQHVPERLKPYLGIFIVIAAVGFGVSLWVHIAALQGRRVLPEEFFWILHLGVFVVWFPAVLVSQRLVKGAKRKDFWKAALRGAPDWMRYAVYVIHIYAFVGFVFFMLHTTNGNPASKDFAWDWRDFSLAWMAFYAAAVAILYSAYKLDESA